jgi:hypothetical protein
MEVKNGLPPSNSKKPLELTLSNGETDRKEAKEIVKTSVTDLNA